MSDPTVLYAEQGAVALLTLNRPQALNSFTRQMHQDLWAALDRAEANADVRALVITGAGRAFCAGADLAEFDFEPGPNLVARADPGPVIDQAFNPTVRRLQNLRMPTLADVLASAPVLAHFQKVVDALAQTATGSANRIARLCLLSEAPTIDRGEITDKGSINQRAVLAHRADTVAALHDGRLHTIIQPLV